MHRLIVPFGFYGSGNIGDEATLGGFARLLASAEVPTRAAVASADPSHTARVEPSLSYFAATQRDPRRWWAKLFADAYVFAGGTPIMDGLGEWPLCEVVPIVRRAVERGKPVAFVGVGTESLQHQQSKDLVARELAPRVRHWSVRSERDRARLSTYGVNSSDIAVAADMAWLLEKSSDEFGREKLRQWGLEKSAAIVGVNLVNEGMLLSSNPHLVETIARQLDKIVEDRGAKILFLANEIRSDASFDIAAAMLVMSKMTRQRAVYMAPPDYYSPAQMMSIIACCEMTISMRYHFCLFSAIQNVPFVSLTRSDKVVDLCWDLNWPAALNPLECDAASLSDAVAKAKSNRISHDRVSQLRQRAMLNQTALAALLPQELFNEESLVVQHK